MQIDHIGYAVKNLTAAVEKFLSLGFQVASEMVQDTERGVDIQFLVDPMGVRVELVAPSQAVKQANVVACISGQ